MERLRCGSLRDVNATTTTSSGLPKKKSKTPDGSKRNRKSFRRNGGVQSLTPPRRTRKRISSISRGDPLNIVGNELFVRDHNRPLSMLEEGSEHSMNSRRGNRQSSKQEDEENSEIKSLLNDAIIDDEEQYNMKLVQQKLQEERLYNLSKVPAGLPISTEINPIDQQLGYIEEVQAILHSYSSSSLNGNSSTSSISTVQSSPSINKGQEQANKILHKIHGKRRISNTHYQKRNIYPNCPNCSNTLIYLYLHHTTSTCPTVPKLTTSHLHSGTLHNTKSTKYKLQNILPPKCIECNIYYIYDYISSVYKDIMIDNMMRWIDNIENGDDSSNDDAVTDDNGTYVNEFGVVVDGSKYPRCSKLVVINSTPKSGDDAKTEEKKRGFHETMQITTSFQQRRSNNLTPRPLKHERQNSRVSFKFDNEDCPVYSRVDNGDEVEEMETMVVSPRPLFSPRNDTGGTIFSGLSSLTEQPRQREGGRDGDTEVKKSLSDEDPFTDISCNGSDDEEDMDDEEKDVDNDEDGDSCGSRSQWLSNCVNDERDTVGKKANEVDICQDDKKDEEDNIQDVAIEDEKIPLAPPPPPQAESDGSKNVETVDKEITVEQTQNQEDLRASSSVITNDESVASKPDTSSIKSSESNSNNIKLIHTESEERMILEKYSIKKEIATRQIAKDLILGHELTTLECQRCKMPMTKMKDNEGKLVECTTCQAVKRNAKRIARRKRSKLSIRSGAASVDEEEESPLSPGSILSQEVTKVQQPPPDNEFVDRTNDINLFYFHPDEKGGKVNIPVNALSVLEQGPIVQENENTTLVSLNRDDIQDLTALEEGLRISDEIDPIEVLSCTETLLGGNSGDGSSSSAASSDNSIRLNNNIKDREGDDYWLRHAIMSNNVKQMMIQPSSLNPHIYPSAHTPSTTRKEPSGSATTDEIEYSLSFYQENVKQQTEEYSRQQSNAVSTSVIAAPSVDELSSSQYHHGSVSEASGYQLYQEILALENQVAADTPTLPVSEKEQWLAALAIPVGGSKDKLDLSRRSHSTSLHHPESISEVSEYSKQVLGSSSSDESSTRCPRTLPASEMTYQPNYFPAVETEGDGSAQLDYAYTGSISEVSGYNERPLVPNEINQQQNDISTVDILIGLSSDESLTKCPRDLPPSGMLYPVQSIANIDHQDQQAIKPTENNLRLVAPKKRQEHPTPVPTLLTPFDLQNVEDDHNDEGDTKLMKSEIDTEDSSVVSGEKGDGSALLQASLSPSSLNERIARLAESLREVASQLPKNDSVNEPKQPHPSSDDTKLVEIDIMQNDMLSVLEEEEEEEEEEEDPSSQVPHIHQRTCSPIQHNNDYQFEKEIVDQQVLPSRHRSPLHRLQSAPLTVAPCSPFRPISLRSNSVGNNGHGISISPINVCRDEKQFDLFSSDKEEEKEEVVHPSPKKIQRCDHIIKNSQECIPSTPPLEEDRADPPGRRVEASGHEIRDPPENDLTTNVDHNRTTHSPSSKDISSTNLTPLSEKNQSGRDPPPSTTPKSRGRRRKRLIAACNDDDATEEKLVEEMKVAASRPDFIHRNKPITSRDRKPLSLEVDDDAYSVIDAPQSTKSSGSMNELFQQIDDLEIDFQRTIASMPGSEGMSSASLKSYSNDNHSLVEITLNNGINSMDSFESGNLAEETEEDSLVSDDVESMGKIKDCIARSVDEEDDCRSDIDTVSQCESETMTVLMNRLAKAADELREINLLED